ncbi:hypothetical protein [Methylocaldum sp.]|uniref:hypothetical protein n=1 Tax=Methylocaldum sp. TaxID=1969727 RepID=UPI002D537264|nr:hypothetical protein [Methylocaldum sp.]HYE38152.1 hypothetical protein [Methylocaldum sp.]
MNGVTQDSHVLAAGVTGNFSKALDIPLSDGDDLRLEVDGGVDVTSMTIARMHLLMTSDTNEVDLGGYGATNFSTTPQYVHLGGVATSSSASATGRGVPIGYSGEIRNPRLYVASTGGNTVTANLKKNGVTALTVTGVAADGWIENTVDTVGFGPTDEFYWEVYTSSGTATVQQMFATVSNVQVSRFADGTSSGEAEGDAVGRADTAATGTSSGSGQASAAAIVFEPAVGEAEGAATVAGFGYGRVNTVGIADTGAFAQGAGSTIGIINGAGLSFGSAQVDGHGESGAAAQGIALASARAAAAAKQVGWRRGRRLSGSWTKQGADI